MNQAMIFGRVGRDPKTHTLNGGGKVTGFSVATSEKFTNKAGERTEKTCWHNVKVWGPLADVVESRVRKGVEVFVIGKIENGSYEKDGQKVYTSEIVLQGPGTTLRIFDNASPASEKSEPKRTDHEEKTDKLDDSIPF